VNVESRRGGGRSREGRLSAKKKSIAQDEAAKMAEACDSELELNSVTQFTVVCELEALIKG
jgi:hypothetical protein